MSSGRHCCIPGCKESGGMHQVLHGFPNPVFDRERFNTWLYAIGCHDILGLKNEQILRHRVCRAHFEDKHLCRNNRLSNIAVPTLKMPTLLSRTSSMSTNRQPLQQIHNLPSTSSAPLLPSFTSIIGCLPQQILGLPPMSDARAIMHEDVSPEIENQQNLDLTATMQEEVALPSTSETNMQINLAGIRTVRKIKNRVFLSNIEKELHEKLVAARIKISKMKNKVKLSANVKAAKRIASNPAVFDILENCTSTGKLLIRVP